VKPFPLLLSESISQFIHSDRSTISHFADSALHRVHDGGVIAQDGLGDSFVLPGCFAVEGEHQDGVVAQAVGNYGDIQQTAPLYSVCIT